MFTNTTPGGTAVKRSFLVNDVTEFTGNLKPMCEWCFSGKKDGTLLLSRCTQQGGTRTRSRGGKLKIIVFNEDKARHQGRARQGKADMDRHTGE